MSVPPAVVHIPHASTAIPEDVHRTLLLPEDDLESELLRLTDRYTDELFALPTNIALSVTFPVSRLVVDPERFMEDEHEPMAQQGMGVIYSRTSAGGRLRSDLSPSARMDLLAKYYFPHHDRLNEAVSACRDEHVQCLLIDGHSFASKPLPHEPDQAPHRCDICIGTDAFHTPPWLSELAVGIFQERGFEVGINRPFSGTLVPSQFFRRDSSVRSIMVEVNRSFYMDESSGQRLPGFADFAGVLRRLLSEIIIRTQAQKSG